MLRSFSCQIVKRARLYTTRLDCPHIPAGALMNEGKSVRLSALLDDWRNTIIQLQDDADRLQWQVDVLTERLLAKEREEALREDK